MHKRPKILLTNDDGIDSTGLRNLWKALRDTADLFIVAPMHQQSGAGASITIDRPLAVKTVKTYEETPAWMVDGKPADCVKLGLQALLSEKPDYIFSGINHGSNAGRIALFSGTVGATIEGMLHGIPGVAFSYSSYEDQNLPDISSYILKIYQYLNKHPLPQGTLLNVTFPHLPTEKIKGCKMARQGAQAWKGTPERTLSKERVEFLFNGDDHDFDEPLDSDAFLLSQGYITAVPLFFGELTHHDHLDEKKQAFEDHFFLL
jgi:5'-nucleotidase